MQTALSSEMSLFTYKSTCRYDPQDRNLNNHHSSSFLKLILKFLVYSKRGRAPTPPPFSNVGNFQKNPPPVRKYIYLHLYAVPRGAAVARQDPVLSLHQNTRDAREGRHQKKMNFGEVVRGCDYPSFDTVLKEERHMSVQYTSGNSYPVLK
jgi:hypothetical protein